MEREAALTTRAAGQQPSGLRTGGASPKGPRRGFALLSPEFLDELRARVTLSTLIGRSVPLKKAGNEWKACCPFHSEKTPSFWVNDQKGFFHCFGCGAHGDAIRFLTDARGMAFKDAVQELADGVGLELPKPDPASAARQQRASGLIDVVAAAADFYRRALSGPEGRAARAYLDQRGVGEMARTAFGIGYAPDARDRVATELKAFPTDQLVEAGLLIKVDERAPYDRFRGRLMVPIRDARGRTVGFGGRVLDGGEHPATASGQPKYLNSPDTPLFDKGRVLYNLDRAAPASRQSGRLIVVEGYLDVIALDQAGIREAVAPMGTALTEPQLEQLWQLVDAPILCFDGDAAGRRAAERAAERAMASLRPGKHLLFALLPDGKDPDDLVREGGAAAMEAVLAQAQPLSTFLYRVAASGVDRDSPEQRAALRTRLEEVANTGGDRHVADEFARSFRSLFFEDFGWKRDQRRAIATTVLRTSARVAPNLARLYVRSALYGLTRFPAVAAMNLEALAAIPIAHADLRRWRDAIAEAVLIDPNLDEDGIAAILSAAVLPETMAYSIRSDLRFGFTVKRADVNAAQRQLITLVTFLAEEHAIADQLTDLDRAAVADAGGDRYEAIEVARQRLREARIALLEQSMDLDGQVAAA